MATQYPNNLEITVEQPVDTRLSAKDSTERDSFKYLYPGLLTYLRSEKKFYYYDNGWKELSAGIKIVASTSELESNATQGSMAIVASATETLIYIKGIEQWENFVVNNLTTEDSNLSLSAAQGKALKETIDNLKVNSNRLEDNAVTTNKIADGNVTTAKLNEDAFDSEDYSAITDIENHNFASDKIISPAKVKELYDKLISDSITKVLDEPI